MERSRLSYPAINTLDFAVYGINYVTMRELEYDGIKIPCGYVFDGVTARAPFTFLFSTKDLRQGIRASCFHDWLCLHKSEYSRTYATDVLVDLWKQDGLNPVKAWIVKISVNAYQIIKGGWLTNARGADNVEELKKAWLESKDKIRAENPYNGSKFLNRKSSNGRT